MTDYADAEPLLTDHRLGLIEAMVRLRYPNLPDGTVFVTARMGEEGHFILRSPVPGLPDEFRMQTTRRVPLSRFDRYERERGHYVNGGSEDPARWIFESLAADQLQRLAGAAEMNHPGE